MLEKIETNLIESKISKIKLKIDRIADLIEHQSSIVEKKLKDQSNGTGLGLYMTHKIVTKHLKGTIHVENCEYEFNGKKLNGANFIISIPRPLNILG